MNQLIDPRLLDRACRRYGHQIYGGGQCRRCGCTRGETRSGYFDISRLIAFVWAREREEASRRPEPMGRWSWR